MSVEIDVEHLKRARNGRLWSQEDLAEASGLGLRTIQRLEKEGRGSRETLKALAAAFDTDAVDFVRPAKRTGMLWGFGFGVGGAVLGYAFALRGIYRGVSEGALTAAEAGQMAGFLGLAVGLVCAAIGYGVHRYGKQLRRQALASSFID